MYSRVGHRLRHHNLKVVHESAQVYLVPQPESGLVSYEAPSAESSQRQGCVDIRLDHIVVKHRVGLVFAEPESTGVSQPQVYPA